MRIFLHTMFIIIMFFLNTTNVHSAGNVDVALLLKKSGKVLARRAESSKWSNTNIGMRFNSGDMIYAGKKSLAAVMFTDDRSLIKIRNNSSFLIQAERKHNDIVKRLKVFLGQVWIKTSKQKTDLIIETPSGVAAIKGTEFYCMVESEAKTLIVVIEGTVSLKNSKGEVLINAGETGYAEKDKAPGVEKSDPQSIPLWGNTNESNNEIKIEFQDSEGNSRQLNIHY